MKVLALNGSPKGKNSNTDVLLKYFLKGCENRGADIERIYLNEKNIKHCCGCFTCWEKTPGKCVYNDDMEELLVKLKNADIVIYGTPVYCYTTSGIMKDFLDRSIPLCSGEIIQEEDNTYSHPKQDLTTIKTKRILIANSGFPGEYNFSALVESFKLCGGLDGQILCPQAGFLRGVEYSEKFKEIKDLYIPYFKAVEKAGEEIIINGYISKETESILNEQVLDSKIYVDIANSRLK